MPIATGAEELRNTTYIRELNGDTERLSMLLLPHLIAKSSKSKGLLRLLSEVKLFLANSNKQEEVQVIDQLILEYKQVCISCCPYSCQLILVSVLNRGSPDAVRLSMLLLPQPLAKIRDSWIPTLEGAQLVNARCG